MYQNLLKNTWKSYLLVAIFGIAMGISVGLTAHLPSDDLWGFGYWATGVYGFWILSCSLLVLLSNKRKTAIINTLLYVTLVYFTTMACKLFYAYFNNSFPTDTPFFEWLFGDFSIYFRYSIIAIIGSGILAALLYAGRLNTIPGKIIRSLPLIVISAEALLCGYDVITRHHMLFYFLVDIACAVIYYVVILRHHRSLQLASAPQNSSSSKTTHTTHASSSLETAARTHDHSSLETAATVHDNSLSETAAAPTRQQILEGRIAGTILAVLAAGILAFFCYQTFVHKDYTIEFTAAIPANSAIDVQITVYNQQGSSINTFSLGQDDAMILSLPSGTYHLEAIISDDTYQITSPQEFTINGNTQYQLQLEPTNAGSNSNAQ